MGVYFSAAATDLHSTHRFLQYQGTHEANPIGQFLETKPNALVASSALLEVVAVPLLHKVWGSKHPKLERVLLYSVAAVRFHLAHENYRFADHLARTGQRKR